MFEIHIYVNLKGSQLDQIQNWICQFVLFPFVETRNFLKEKKYGGLKKKCIVRLAKAKLEMEKKMTLPILPALLCCSASKEHTAQLTTKKRDRGRGLRIGMHFLFLE